MYLPSDSLAGYVPSSRPARRPAQDRVRPSVVYTYEALKFGAAEDERCLDAYRAAYNFKVRLHEIEHVESCAKNLKAEFEQLKSEQHPQDFATLIESMDLFFRLIVTYERLNQALQLEHTVLKLLREASEVKAMGNEKEYMAETMRMFRSKSGLEQALALSMTCELMEDALDINDASELVISSLFPQLDSESNAKRRRTTRSSRASARTLK